MSISVALCTFNGAAHLGEQWSSLLAQTHPPDEVVVFDDASVDTTWDLLRDMAARAPWPVRLHRNPTNVGYVRNFERAIAACESELIALCDQDDIWVPDKLLMAVDAFRQRPELVAFFSDASLIDGSGDATGLTAWQCVRFTPQQVAQLNAGGGRPRLWNSHTVTGAALVFRRSLCDVALPFPEEVADPEGWHSHDGWIAALASSVGAVHAEAIPLVHYRIHAGQSLGLLAPELTEHYFAADNVRDDSLAAELDKITPIRDRLSCCGPALGRKQGVRSAKLLDARVQHLARRLQLRGCPLGLRAAGIAAECARGRYHRHSRGLRSAAIDLMRR